MIKLFYILIGLFLVCTGIGAQDKILYDSLLNRVQDLSVEQVIQKGDTCLAKQHQDTAIVLYTIAFSRFHNGISEEEKKFCAVGYLKTGNVYYLQGNYTDALDLYIKGLKICESCNDKTELMKFYNNIGNIYCMFDDYERGIDYYEKGYELRGLYPNKEVEINLLANLTGICCQLKDTEKARMYYYKSEEIREPQDTVKAYMSLYNWGLILVSEEKYPEAIRTFHKAAEFTKKNQMSTEYLCSVYEELFQTYQLMNQEDSTIYYLHLCNELAEKNNMIHLFAQTLKVYSDYYDTKGNTEKTQYYKSKYLSIMDSVYNVREFNRVRNQQFLYEVEKTNREISNLHIQQEMKEQRIRLQQKILTGILIGLLIISSLLIVMYRQKKKIQNSYRDLFNMNKSVIASEKYNKDLRLKYEQKIKVLQHELNQFQSQESGEVHKEGSSDAKYQASKLNDTQKQALIEAIQDVMENTKAFCEDDFSLEKLASLINSNSKYVSQVINETYQKNFSNFINEYRIQEACVRLMDTAKYGNYTIQAIAESVGYKSHSSFIKVFRKITGIPPSIYQKMAREQLD